MVVVSKQPNWLVIFSIIRMIRKDIMTSFVIGGGPIFMKILHFLTPQTIALGLTVMLLLHLCCISLTSLISWSTSRRGKPTKDSVIWSRTCGMLFTALQLRQSWQYLLYMIRLSATYI